MYKIYTMIMVMLMISLSFLVVYVSACPVCYLPVEEAIALMPKVPSYSPVLKNLTYIYEENLSKDGEFGGSDFGGYPTLKQRSDSFDIRESMSVHCGYVLSSSFLGGVWGQIFFECICKYSNSISLEFFYIIHSCLFMGLFFSLIRFVRGIKPGRNTGYDMDDADLLEMEQCRGVVVASAIFGNVL